MTHGKEKELMKNVIILISSGYTYPKPAIPFVLPHEEVVIVPRTTKAPVPKPTYLPPVTTKAPTPRGTLPDF